jgi:2,4-dienoyl-CoA reductase-like NADH-dependent reductase (Old Yellow Enzyme family)
LSAAKVVKKANPDAIVAAVGGWRDLNSCIRAIARKEVDLISISRPFIREPNLIEAWATGKKKGSDCKSCNGCIFGLGKTGGGVTCTYV